MHTYCCGDVVPGCSQEVTGSEDEIVAAMDEHVRADHGLPELPPEMERAIRSALAG
jgi:predicted small metal-binding protein